LQFFKTCKAPSLRSFTVWDCVQGEAIAFNLREMFGIKVPIIATVIGEGGSGGALVIGCGNKMLMLGNAIYHVAR
jgi:acetyl-CoA carboxylase carboxyl transferase subunit alpha